MSASRRIKIEAAQSHAVATDTPYSHRSACVPIEPGLPPAGARGSEKLHHPKSTRVMSCCVIGACLKGYARRFFLKISGGNVSNAFAPASMCQPKCVFAAASPKSGSRLSSFQ